MDPIRLPESDVVYDASKRSTKYEIYRGTAAVNRKLLVLTIKTTNRICGFEN